VAEVAEQRAIRLVELEPAPLALRVVRLGDADRDDAVGVPGHHRRRVGVVGIGEELEREAALGVVLLARDREAESHEAVDEPPLRHLEAVPRVAVPAEVGDDARQAAGLAERLGVIGRHRPVAHVLAIVVGAQAIRARLGRARAPPRVTAGGLERAHVADVGQVRERVAAGHAADVLEEDELLAAIAVEDAHGDPEQSTGRGGRLGVRPRRAQFR
jgi:hypothetical protein